MTDASAEVIGRVLDRLGVDQRNKKSLIEKIRTDGWKSYGKAAKDKDLEHLRVILMNPKMAGQMLPWTHLFVSNVKAVLRGPHRGVSAKHLQRYLSEACYRFNRLLFACTLEKPIARDRLLGAPSRGSPELCQ